MPSTYDLIETKSPNGVTSVTFSNIPQTYDDLILISSAISSISGADNLCLTFNGDTNANYFEETWYTPSATSMQYTGPANNIRIQYQNNNRAFSKTEICQYSQTLFTKTMLIRKNDQSAGYVMLRAGRWNSTSSITSLTVAWQTVTTNFAAGSVLTLFGIAGA